MRRQYQRMDNSSGVGVLDKAAIVLGALEAGPASLATLVAATGLARPTAHRPAPPPWSTTGSWRATCKAASSSVPGCASSPPLPARTACSSSGAVLARLRDITGESAQLYRRQGDSRVCVAAAERLTGLRDTVPVGATLTMKAGSAAQILLAWEEPERLHRGLREARFTATALSAVRRRGWSRSVGEGSRVASVSAPVRGPAVRIVAAVSGLGPDRTVEPSAGRLTRQIVCAAAAKLSEVLQNETPPWGFAAVRAQPARAMSRASALGLPTSRRTDCAREQRRFCPARLTRAARGHGSPR